MTRIHDWGSDLVTDETGEPGLEALAIAGIVQGNDKNYRMSYFKPVNITVEQGVFYVSLYVCCLTDDAQLTQGLSIWLNGLKETDHIKLSVSAMFTNISYAGMISTLAAFANTKAKIEIILDQIVVDGLAYFYLLADQITRKVGGALFIPSYIDQRSEDVSAIHRAVHDLFRWIVEDAVTAGRLTQEQADRLNSGEHVVLD